MRKPLTPFAVFVVVRLAMTSALAVLSLTHSGVERGLYVIALVLSAVAVDS